MMKPIHLESKNPVLRSNLRRAHRLNEKAPEYNGSPESIHAIIEWLNVEKSARYLRNTTSTFCNIYAYDYATLLGAFVPRIWWNALAYPKVMQGENVPIKYGETVIEMNANQLYDWFKAQSSKFGWKQVTMDQGQEAANKGKCVIIVGANVNRSRSGHITAIVPETDRFKAVRSPKFIPLQSQAGAVNFKYRAVDWQRNHEPLLCYIKD
jgi:hypothetical protein